MGRLDKHIALVTGAGRGIGRAIALRYASEGATVVITDVNEEGVRSVADELRKAGAATVDAFRCDSGDVTQIRAMVDRVAQRFGRLDVMVNNAGVIRVQPFLDVTEKDWDAIHHVNARGLFFSVQAAARQILQQEPLVLGRPRGKIINIASIAGRQGRPMFAAYAASKAAVISITQSSASAFAPSLTVNSICPGPVDTDMWKLIDQQYSAADGRPLGTAWKERMGGIPMGRPEKADDLTGMALFLASSDSDFITGQSYHVDGGVNMN